MTNPDVSNSKVHPLKVIEYLWGILFHPFKTTENLLQEREKITYASFFILIFSSLYTVYVAVLYVKGIEPYYWEPFLRIPLERWYLFQTFITIPVTFSTWILLAGLIQLLSRPFKGAGSFEDTAVVLALPMMILIPLMLIPDIFVDFILPDRIVHSFLFWNFVNPLRLFCASMWVVGVQILAVKKVQALSFSRTLVVTGVSYILYMFFNFTYIH